MFISKNTIQKIEDRYIGRRVQRSATVKSGITKVEMLIPGAPPQVGTVIGVAFDATSQADGAASDGNIGVFTDSGTVAFRLLVEPDSGVNCQIWSNWTLIKDEQRTITLEGPTP